MNLFLIQNEQQTGPHTFEQVQALLLSLKVSGDTPAWQTGMQDWATLSEIPELAEMLNQAENQPTARLAQHSLEAPPIPPDAICFSAIPGKRFEIRFGSAYAIDEHGFVGAGTFEISMEWVSAKGTRHHGPSIKPAGILIDFRGVAGALIAGPFGATLVHYLGGTQDTVRWQKAALSKIRRSGRKISFIAPQHESGKPRKVVFRATNSLEAEEIERELQGN